MCRRRQTYPRPCRLSPLWGLLFLPSLGRLLRLLAALAQRRTRSVRLRRPHFTLRRPRPQRVVNQSAAAHCCDQAMRVARGLRPRLQSRSWRAVELQRPSRSGTGPSRPRSVEGPLLLRAVLLLIVFQLQLLRRSAWEGALLQACRRRQFKSWVGL